MTIIKYSSLSETIFNTSEGPANMGFDYYNSLLNNNSRGNSIYEFMFKPEEGIIAKSESVNQGGVIEVMFNHEYYPLYKYKKIDWCYLSTTEANPAINPCFNLYNTIKIGKHD